MLLILNTKKLSEIKKELNTLENVIPVTKRHLCSRTFSRYWSWFNYQSFIDCGKVRNETSKLQLWDANDFEHRLKPRKLLILLNCLKSFGIEDNDIEVEYQGKLSVNTIWFNGKDFTLLNKQPPA
jgi:hypothetical protein